MKKRLMIFLLVFVSLFAFNSVSAETTTCNYKLSSEGKEASFVITNGSASRAEVTGDAAGGEIKNWEKALKGTSFVGEDYYKNNGNKCPDYLLSVIKHNIIFANDYYVYVADSDSYTSIEKELEQKYDRELTIYKIPLVGSEEQKEENENNLPSSCLALTKKGKYACENDEYFACIWNDNEFGEYCNVDKLLYVRCADSFDIPYQAPSIISFLITLLKVAIPIILIFVAIISLLKAVGAANEDEIKKAQKSLIRKIVAAVLAFFVISIVQFVIMKVADTADADDISSCLSCFMNNDCGNTLYYKTNVGGTYFCTDSSGTKPCE